MKKLNIAIIGAGTAGLASAIFFKRAGYSVTVFEKFEEPKPIGAGLLLQPSGLSVLSLLGLDIEIIEKGCKITQLYGRDYNSKNTTLDVKYSDFAEHLFGVGTHRGNLFTALYNKAIETNVIFKNNCNIIEKENNKLIDINGNYYGDFDLIIDASGQKSNLRKAYANIKLDKQYPFGAIWAVANINEEDFRTYSLDQRYKNANHMIGVLPVSKENNKIKAAYFYSMRTKDFAKWKSTDFEEWKKYAESIYPETNSILKQFKSHDDLTIATYSDIILKKYYNDNIVFIGDSAHCTSPQLGQGANLALIDAKFLFDAIDNNETIEVALKAYNKSRIEHLWFYQTASRLLTPLFQSDLLFASVLRYIILGIICKLKFLKYINSSILIGTKIGFFSSINPGDWAKDYNLKQ